MPCRSSFPLLLLLILRSPGSWSYEAPAVKQDVFARRACPAFLTFINAAYLAGVTVELPCHCKPQQVQSVVWFFKKHLSSFEEIRVLTDHHGNKLLDTNQIPHGSDLRSRFFIRLFSLLIFRAGPEDSGIYICGSAQNDFFYAYDVDIQEARTLSLRLTPESTGKRVNERRQKSSGRPWYRVFTSFRPWSVCDRCGVPGEQFRVGLCYVHSHYLHVRYRRANETVASCGSGAVPRAFSHLKQNKVGAHLEVKSCQVTCPSRPPPPSKLLALMEFLGYRSASMPADVPVFYLKHPAGHVLTIGCPKARPNMAVAWDLGSKPIYRFKQSAGHNVSVTLPRIRIDTGHHLVLTPAITQDTGVYYCWLQGQQAAEIRLLVYPYFGRGQSLTSHPDFPAAVRTILTSYAAMTVVFCMLILGRVAVRVVRDTSEAHVD
ncbi:Ig-like V-type domain-containing protein FAM187A [Aulostomus maculatus]